MENSTSNESVMTLLHDISGPIATSRGIQRELADSIKSLSDEINALDSVIAQGQLKQLQGLIEADIDPCLEHLNASLSTLNSRVKNFSTLFTAD